MYVFITLWIHLPEDGDKLRIFVYTVIYGHKIPGWGGGGRISWLVGRPLDSVTELFFRGVTGFLVSVLLIFVRS